MPSRTRRPIKYRPLERPDCQAKCGRKISDKEDLLCDDCWSMVPTKVQVEYVEAMHGVCGDLAEVTTRILKQVNRTKGA
jgi:hypothetical protein